MSSTDVIVISPLFVQKKKTKVVQCNNTNDPIYANGMNEHKLTIKKSTIYKRRNGTKTKK